MKLVATLTLRAPTPQNGLTQSNNLSTNYRRIAWVCLTILWGWRLKGLMLRVLETFLQISKVFSKLYRRSKWRFLPSVLGH